MSLQPKVKCQTETLPSLWQLPSHCFYFCSLTVLKQKIIPSKHEPISNGINCLEAPVMAKPLHPFTLTLQFWRRKKRPEGPPVTTLLGVATHATHGSRWFLEVNWSGEVSSTCPNQSDGATCFPACAGHEVEDPAGPATAAAVGARRLRCAGGHITWRARPGGGAFEERVPSTRVPGLRINLD